MLSDLPVSSLSKGLTWLIWLIGAAVLLLIGSLVSFNYMEGEADRAQLEAFNRIDNDTLAGDSPKRALTVAHLMVSPQTYHEHYVWVKGYLNLEFEGDALYWRQSDYRANQYKNSFYVQFTDSLYQTKPVATYSQHYVMLKGIFAASEGLHSGAILKIDSLYALPKNAR